MSTDENACRRRIAELRRAAARRPRTRSGHPQRRGRRVRRRRVDGQGHRVYTLEGADRPYRILRRADAAGRGHADRRRHDRLLQPRLCRSARHAAREGRRRRRSSTSMVEGDRPSASAACARRASGASQAEVVASTDRRASVPVLLTVNTMPPGERNGVRPARHRPHRAAAPGEAARRRWRALRDTEEAAQGRADCPRNRRKDEFLATLAHELRNPLAPIRNALADHAAAARADEARRAGPRHDASGSSQHMVRLVDDLLDVSRITQGKIELRKEPVDTGRRSSAARSRPAGR